MVENDGAERSGARSEGYRNRLERGAGFSPQCLRCRIFDVWHVGPLWVHSSSYLSWCIKRVRAISRLDNARYALSGLVIARSQAVERAFTEKGCTLHGLKEALHRAVSDKREFYAASFSSRSGRRDAVVAHTRCLYRQQRDNLPD